ncbi:MAG TPA: hypothetical protein VME43_23405 [Bryobacteraceae bacterium]|nr:hypothetical protein [Bryobacteraceae bacterium]
MKPLQIALLVVAGALCGAVVMKVADRPKPAEPLVTAEVPPEPAPATPKQAEPAAAEPAASQTAPAEEPAAAPNAPATPTATAAGAAVSGATTAGGHEGPVPSRHVAVKPRVRRPVQHEPVKLARVRPSYVAPYVPPRPAASALPVSAAANPPAAMASAATPGAAQAEPPASTLPPARRDPENVTPPSPAAIPGGAPEGAPVGTPQAPPPPEPNRVTLIAGLLIPVRLVDGLSSERNQPGDTFHATLVRELAADGFVIAERGARVEGRVVAVDRGGKVSGVASLALALTTVHTSDGQAVAIQTDPFNRHAEQTHLQDAEKIGGAAAFGAIIGALAGGGKGAAAGAGVGGGAGTGAVLLTRGAAATLPSETRITFRLRSPVTITERQ